MQANVEQSFESIERVEATFQVGDMAVHPAHGVGAVTGIEKRDLGGSVNLFYVLKIIDSGLKVMIPVTATAQVGLRHVMSQKEAAKFYIFFARRGRGRRPNVEPTIPRVHRYAEERLPLRDRQSLA